MYLSDPDSAPADKAFELSTALFAYARCGSADYRRSRRGGLLKLTTSSGNHFADDSNSLGSSATNALRATTRSMPACRAAAAVAASTWETKPITVRLPPALRQAAAAGIVSV